MHKLLKKIRKDNDLTQEEMAKMIGVSRSCIANWESGIREADISIIKKYNELFGYKNDIAQAFTRLKCERQYCLDITMLNPEGTMKIIKYYNELINNPKYLKNS